MGGGISTMAKRELLATIRDRYRESSKKEKGPHPRRVHSGDRESPQARHPAVGQSGADWEKPSTAAGRRVYDEAVA